MSTLEHASYSGAIKPLSIFQKFSFAAYGLLAYTIGCAGIGAIVLAAGGFLPLGEFVAITTNPVLAVIINVALTLLFGLQHSIMARPGFKRVFHAAFGQAGERSTFIWTSGVCALIMIYCWQPLPGVVWQVSSPLGQGILWAGFAAGWAYLLAATFAINHWDLFGLRQVWLAIGEREYSEPAFKENWMYRFGRHPIMLGVLIGVWSLPTMTVTQLVLTVTLTAYIFIGVAFEERDLIRHFGHTYLDYKKRVGMFFTLWPAK